MADPVEFVGVGWMGAPVGRRLPAHGCEVVIGETGGGR